MATLTPILIGIAAIALLYPVLARLKLPGFEADIRQAEVGQSYLPSPQFAAELSMLFLGSGPQQIIKILDGRLGLTDSATASNAPSPPSGALPSAGTGAEPQSPAPKLGLPEPGFGEREYMRGAAGAAARSGRSL